MKISVIIPTYNAADTLDQALSSVIAQNYKDFEIILVDGGSTDETLIIAQNYRNYIGKLIHEPDEGVFDAVNKGILASSGDVTVFLGADDYFYDVNVFSAVVHTFIAHPEADIVYGDYLRDKGYEKILFRHPEPLGKYTFFLRNPLCQHAVFVRRKLFDRVGLFDTTLKIAADHDWNLRVFGEHQVSHVHIPTIICGFRSGGLSSTPAAAREHAIVRRRYFPWPYELIWHGWHIGRRGLHRLHRLRTRFVHRRKAPASS